MSVLKVLGEFVINNLITIEVFICVGLIAVIIMALFRFIQIYHKIISLYMKLAKEEKDFYKERFEKTREDIQYLNYTIDFLRKLTPSKKMQIEGKNLKRKQRLQILWIGLKLEMLKYKLKK